MPDATLGSLTARIGLDTTGLAVGVAAARGELAALNTSGSSSLRTLASVGQAAFVALGAAAVVVGGASIAAAADFEESMLRVRTQAGASQTEVDNMSAAILRMATGLGTSPNALADALFRIESTGIRGAAALELLEAAAMGAKIGGADLTAVTMGLLAITNSHISGVESQAAAMGILNGIVGVSNVTMEELAHALGTGLLPVAAAVGVSIQDVGAALGVLTSTGLPAEVAANRLRVTLSLMSAPTTEAQGALRMLGLESDELAKTMREEGLIAAIDLLKTSLEHSGLTAEQQAQVIRAAFGGGETSSAILTLIGNFDALVAKEGELGKGATDFQDSWEATKETFSFQMDQMRAAVEVLAIKIGTALIPIVTAMAEALADAVDWLKEHQTVAIALAAVIGGALLAAMAAFVAGLIAANAVVIAVGAGLGAFAVGFGLLYEKVGLAASAVLILISPLAVLAAGVKLAYDNFGPFHDAVDATWQVLQLLWDAVQAAAGVLMEFGRDAIPVVADALAAVGDAFQAFVNGPVNDFVGFFQEIAPQVEEAFGHVVAVVQRIVGDIVTVFSGVADVLGAVIRAALAVISAIWNQWGDDIMQIVRNIFGALEGVINAVFDGIKAVIENAIRILGDIIRLGLALINGDWGKAWDALKDIVDAVWDLIYGVIRAAWDAIFALISGAVQVLGNILDGAWSAIWQGVQAGWDIILNFFRDLPGNIIGFLTALPGLLVNLGQSIITGLWLGIQAAWNVVLLFFGGLGNVILGLVTGAAGWLVNLGQDIINGIWLGIQIAWDAVLNFFRGLPGVIIGIFSGAASWLLNVGSDIINGIWLGIQIAWDAVLGFFRGLPLVIVSFFQRAGSWLLTVGQDIIGGIGAGIVAAWNFVASWFSGIFGRVTGFFVDAGRWLFNTGLDLVVGFLEGILRAWDLVPSFLQNLAGPMKTAFEGIEAVVDRIKDARVTIAVDAPGLDDTSFALSMMADTLDRINNGFPDMWGGGTGGFPSRAVGGLVPGSLGEPVLTMLHGGERVMTRSQQRAQDMLASSAGSGVTGMQQGPTSQSSTTQYILQGDIVANDPAELERQLAARARLSNLTSAA